MGERSNRRSVTAAIIMGLLIISAQALGQEEGEGEVTRTQAEVIALIEEVGRTPPQWWDEVKLKYPKTLDLSWPRPVGDWDQSRNVGQYIWSVINENPSKWRQGVKFLHHVLVINKDNPVVVNKAMDALGAMYHNLHEDWARAAFWWKKAGARNRLGLAHCYWKLGCKSMAADVLSTMSYDYTRHCGVIKLWADMGEYAKAMKLVKIRAAAGAPISAYLAAGDACRLAGRYNTAIKYYRQALEAKNDSGREIDVEMARKRAAASIEAIQLFEMLDLSKIADGVYEASSVAYAGMLGLEVTVGGGRIEKIEITALADKQYYSALTTTPREIIEKQSLKGIDTVTGATITSEAIINATAKALAKGLKE